MRRVLTLVLGVWMTGGVAAADMDSALKAEAEGKWDEAAATWQELRDSAPTALRFQARYLAALEALGNAERLDKACAEAMAAMPQWDVPVVTRARSWAEHGRSAEARVLLQPWVERSLEAATMDAKLAATLSKGEESREIHGQVVSRYNGLAAPTPRERLAAGRSFSALGEYHAAARTLEQAYMDSLDYLPARLALAHLFHAKHQSELAGAEYSGARKLSPFHPDVLVTGAELALLGRNFRGAFDLARQATAVRPGDHGAAKVIAVIDLVAEDPGSARDRMRRVLDQNPDDARAVAVLGAARHLLGEQDAPGNSTLAERGVANQTYMILGELLEIQIRNREAAAWYQRVLDMEPDNTDVLSALGLLTMRMGDEVGARVYLEKAFDLDPFNIRAYNQLELLDYMDTFSEFDFGAYRFRLLAEADSVLVPVLREQMERIRADLVPQFGWEPDNPTIVEIFPSHDWFSARVTGLAWIDGIPGVCFGDVIAMDSPSTLTGRTNWAQVLRHEFGHVLALGMTDYRVPFWFTEGLSVFLEEHPRGRNWDANLVSALWDNELIPVDSLTVAFTRPKKRSQRLLAYHQAGLIIGDIVARHGWEAIPELLHAFNDGKSLEQAVEAVLGESYPDFAQHGYAVCRDRAQNLGLWPAADPSRLAEVLAASSAREDDPELRDRLLIAQYQAGLMGEAENQALHILDREPGHALALGVLGLVKMTLRDTEGAKTYLEDAAANGSRDVPVLMELAALRLADKDTTGALSGFQAALDVYPYLPYAHRMRAELLQLQGDAQGARQAYMRWIETDDSAASGAVALATLEIAAGDAEAAQATLDFALGILPNNDTVLALMGRTRLLQDRDREAYDLFQAARRINIRNVASMVGMASYYFKLEDYEEALYFAQLALKYDPHNSEARDMATAAEAAL